MQRPSPPCQLAAEQRWLHGETPRSFLAPRYNPSPQQIDAAKQAEKVLARRELGSVLRMLEQHNRQRATPFLLAPYLFQIIISVEQRKSVREQCPLLAQSPRKVHAHFRKVAAHARAFARLLREGRPPLDPLLGQVTAAYDLLPLLGEVAAAYDLLAEKTPPRRRQKLPQLSELRRRAVTVLCPAFYREFEQPYYAHVARVVSALTGTPIDVDHIKKIVQRAHDRDNS
jgi:hypothetical protein